MRLDRETSGCLLLARNPEARDMLQAQFKDRTVERIYHAVVHGAPSAQSGTVRARIQETKDMRVRLVKDGKRAGREAITHWEIRGKGKHALTNQNQDRHWSESADKATHGQHGMPRGW